MKKKPLKLSAATHKIIGVGNSIMASVGATTTANGWFTKMQAIGPFTGKSIPCISTAVPGAGITIDTGAGTIRAIIPTIVAALSSTLKNVIIFQEGTNELKGIWQNNGSSWPATAGEMCFNNTKAVINEIKAAAIAAGKKVDIVIIGTVQPVGKWPDTLGATSGQNWTNTRMMHMNTYNNMLRARFREFADFLCDVAGMYVFKTLYDNGDFSPAAFVATDLYDAADTTHPTNPGHALMATCWAHGFRRLT